MAASGRLAGEVAIVTGALGRLALHILGRKSSVRVQMPRIGAGLARGNWTKIAPLIEWHLGKVASVTVLDPPKPIP